MRFLTLIALLLTPNVQAKDFKVAFVNMQRALLEVEEGKKAKSMLEKMKQERQGELDKQQAELRELQKSFEAQKQFMDPPVKQAKEQEFRQKLGQLQMTFAKLQKELAAKEARLTKGIFARMGRILAAIGKKQGYSMIFEKTESSILWAPQHLDLTNELIRRYNKGDGKKKK